MNYYPNYSPYPAPMPGVSSQPMPGYGTSNDELRSRLASMERQASGYPPVQSRPILKSYPVASIEEARAAIIEFNGSLHIFYNIQTGEIYTKQMNMNTGLVDFKVYQMQQDPNQQAQQNQPQQMAVAPAPVPQESGQQMTATPLTKDDLKGYALKSEVDSLTSDLIKLREEFDDFKKGV